MHGVKVSFPVARAGRPAGVTWEAMTLFPTWFAFRHGFGCRSIPAFQWRVVKQCQFLDKTFPVEERGWHLRQRGSS